MTPLDPHWATWNFLVDFGDVAALAPAVAAACTTLWVRGRRRPARVWVAAFGGCIAITFLVKAAAGQSGLDKLDLDFLGAAPSGHTSISIAFYGVLAVVLHRAMGGWRGALAVLAVATINLLVLAAIIRLHWHPWTDIVLGIALGGACAGVAGSAFQASSADRRDAAWAAVAAVLTLFVLHGTRMELDGGALSISHEWWPVSDKVARTDQLPYPEMPMLPLHQHVESQRRAARDP